MGSKFKIGDEVVCVDREEDCWYDVGEHLIISSEGFIEPYGHCVVYNIEGEPSPRVWIVESHFELYKEGQNKDMVNSPNHYILFQKDEIEGDVVEVKHVVKKILERWQNQEKISFDMYQAGCYKELLQYLLRAPLKNNIEDVEKAQYYLKEIIEEW